MDHPLAVVAENFLCHPEVYSNRVDEFFFDLDLDQECASFIIQVLLDEAKKTEEGNLWHPADIHPDSQYDGGDPLEAKLRGNG